MGLSFMGPDHHERLRRVIERNWYPPTVEGLTRLLRDRAPAVKSVAFRTEGPGRELVHLKIRWWAWPTWWRTAREVRALLRKHGPAGIAMEVRVGWRHPADGKMANR